ncbi:MAG: DNA mismatch repair protein MutS [Candidatus Marinimicrobia bacterium]|jgi:DNA mismatch repair protein MutS|nr:DNA mismatch repair protein MutS [Candidatus Neomarinimicrobiota bacterium]MBT3838779.1 DNA mismatch repair protein MutS [Candidatus Neomarinimicrobiota bacterium]MBT3999647.1 DNA mismatch repair protein MutS [Candidatus Neomarinimicrobiota bacterium]MBT4578788.1 DNA mismatch repair protein MutS [Candidatus Neomarinimicrobiota bacterium]MBT4956981.1 DNA mismatch repair protein MutS [Candidatus Neomarinimicrobiota bacterium]
MVKTVVAQTPVMKQFLDVKSKYEDTLVLFRMGDFYETFLEDAEITAKVLGIVLTKRANGKASEVALAGFPYHSLDNYLPKLVKAGYRVAICEQVEDPKLAKGIVKREVIEVVTPGTLTSDQALNKKSNRYIGAISFEKNSAGFAFLDPSTGEFHIGECPVEDLKNYLLKFSPSEMILGENVVYSTTDWYREFRPFITQIEDWIFDFDSSYRALITHFNLKSLKGFGCEDMKIGITTGGALMHHIKTNLSSSINHISKIVPVLNDGFMGLDGYTIRNLEVFQSLATQGTHGTLIDCIDQTQTAGGGRLLRRWLHYPLTNVNKLNHRLDVVESFLQHNRIMKSIRESLGKTADIERILGKVNQGKASPRELIGLALALKKIPEWQKELNSVDDSNLSLLAKSFVDTQTIVHKILSNINEDTPVLIKMGNVICSGVDKDLDELRVLLHSGKEWIENFQNTLRDELEIPKLKVGFNRVFGYFIEITKVHQDKVPETFIRKQTLVNSERYITDELKEYEEKVLNAEDKIISIETRLFSELCQFLLLSISKIHINAKALNRMDLLLGFSATANTQKYVRPVLTNNPELNIIHGRHPVVEQLLPATEKFIPNDLSIHSEKNQIQLVTGPNMAGKSTYLRQVGLITLMAQIGCYVPAKSAKIGVVDRLFTRVGASDNLAGGESTFLVEMNEAANILNNATHKSLILLDEIGRGTATYDGLSLAWAITEYLHNTEGVAARTIFATHYHELTDLESILDRVENYHVEVKEFGDKIVFLRSIAKGTGDKSYGIYVAQMAGLPKSVIHRATEILNHHIQQSEEKNGTSIPPEPSKQMTLFQEQELKLRKTLNELDVNSMTPMEALKTLDNIKKEHGL